jgi:hypothetical protein
MTANGQVHEKLSLCAAETSWKSFMAMQARSLSDKPIAVKSCWAAAVLIQTRLAGSGATAASGGRKHLLTG